MTLLQLWSALNPLGLALARLLVHVLWQSALLLGAIGMLTWTLRKRSASLRHALWVGAILLIPLLPALGYVVTHTGMPRVPVRVDAVALPPVAEPAAAAAGEMAHISVTPTGFPEEPAILQMYARPWTVVVLLYAFGLMRMLGWFGIGLFRLRQWIRRAVPVTEARVLAAFDLARERLGLSRSVKVVESIDVPTPLTLGLLKPVVLLPKNDRQHLSESDMQKIALHECAHIRRHDTLWLRLILLMRTLFFFQPLLWWACRQATLLAEESCDDAVVASTGEALPYANLLTRLADRTVLPSMSTRMATGLLFSRAAFVRRMEAIIDESRSHFRRPSRFIIGTTLLAALLCVTLAVAVPLNAEGRPGTIFAEGKVVDEKGSPLAEASVYACESVEGLGGFKVAAQTRSDTEGRFRFDNLPSREDGEWIYMIYAHKQGYAWASCHKSYRPDVSVPGIMAQGFSDATLALLPPANFTGRVLDRQGEPIAGARISAMFDCKSKDGSAVTYWVWPGGRSFGTIVSDQEGRFRFDSVPAQSQCRLEVAADGYAMIGINSYLEDGYPRRPFFHVDGKEVELRLAPESRILGSVVDAKSGKPFADIAISAFEKNHLAQVFTKTDAAGHFVVKGVPAGAYRVKASVPPKNSYRVRIVTVQVSEGEVREGVELKAEEGVHLVGRVLDKSTGKAIERANVTCVLPEERAGAARTMTDAEGEFHFVVLPGTYGVGAGRAGYGGGGHTAAVVAEGQEEVRLPDILLSSMPEHEKRNVTVSVIDAQGRLAREVKVSWQMYQPLGVTNAEGRLTFDIGRYASVPSQRFTFVSADGDQVGVWILSAEEMAKPPAQKQIALQKAGAIQGIIRAPDGRPVQNAEVTLWMHVPFVQEGNGMTLYAQDLQTTSGPDGTYRIHGLVPDVMYNVSAAGPAGSKTGRARHDDFLAKPGETLPVPEIILPRAERTVSGRFLDANGKPVSLLRFRVEGAQTRPQELSTVENGEFEIQDVVTEDLWLYVTDRRAQMFENRRFEIPKENLHQDLTDVVFTVKRK